MSEKKARSKKRKQKGKERSETVLSSPDDDTAFVIAPPDALESTYTNISYFVGTCCPFVGGCGFYPLICETISSADAEASKEDAWKLKTQEKKVQSQESQSNSDANFLEEEATASVAANRRRKSSKDEASGASHADIYDETTRTRQTITIDDDTQTSELNITTIQKAQVRNTKREEIAKQDNNGYEVIVYSRKSEDHIEFPKKFVGVKSNVHVNDIKDEVDLSPIIMINSRTAINEHKLYNTETLETKGINLRDVNAKSVLKFKESVAGVLKFGMSGLREFVEKRSQMLPKQKVEWDFIDHFAAKDGCKYIGILEQFYNQYNSLVDEAVSKIKSEKKKAKFNEATKLITQIHEILAVDTERNFLEFNFPMAFERICTKFPIDLKPKFTATRKMHDYGTQMIEHWLKKLQAKNRPVLLSDIYEVTTEFMADIMVICFATFTKIIEFLNKLAEGPTREQYEKFTLEFLTKTFRNLLDSICDEIGAVAEAAGQVVLRIPGLSQQDVINTMTKIYTQVNYADINASRGIEACEPIIQIYYLKYFVLSKGPGSNFN